MLALQYYIRLVSLISLAFGSDSHNQNLFPPMSLVYLGKVKNISYQYLPGVVTGPAQDRFLPVMVWRDQPIGLPETVLFARDDLAPLTSHNARGAYFSAKELAEVYSSCTDLDTSLKSQDTLVRLLTIVLSAAATNPRRAWRAIGSAFPEANIRKVVEDYVIKHASQIFTYEVTKPSFSFEPVIVRDPSSTFNGYPAIITGNITKDNKVPLAAFSIMGVEEFQIAQEYLEPYSENPIDVNVDNGLPGVVASGTIAKICGKEPMRIVEEDRIKLVVRCIGLAVHAENGSEELRLLCKISPSYTEQLAEAFDGIGAFKKEDVLS